ATFGWLCVETAISPLVRQIVVQPPSGGCVLKLIQLIMRFINRQAATFGWLCVETVSSKLCTLSLIAATFGWLCVETVCCADNTASFGAATFGWLCVETN
ncbi:hypothetical protein HMPREF9065_01209, partial [Aggregatibacter sp. oral taxon 458 str. W10330]